MNESAAEKPGSGLDHLREQFHNLHEFVAIARAKLDRDTWDYLIGGAETETTLRRNRLALESLAFRPRVLRNVNSTDTSSTFLGHKTAIPVGLAPIGSTERFDPAGTAAVADVAGSFGCPMLYSSVAKTDLVGTSKVSDGFKIFQLYVHGDHAWVEAAFDRAVAAGYGALCLTLDNHYHVLSKRYHSVPPRDPKASYHQKALDWAQFDKIRTRYKLPIILKGIATAEDATIAIKHGADVVYVSNHGGRQLDHGAGTLDLLPEIVSATKGKAEIVVDGGICRGTDVLKAIALGANMVCVGKLYAFGMAAAGRDGIFRVLELLQEEMVRTMALLGVNRISELDPSYVRPAQPVRSPHVLSAFPYLDAPDDDDESLRRG
jgi:isopentenyl diphosphate isomerase/L-lactate dehydrogenase-like FMN-dependent dehydrogenase